MRTYNDTDRVDNEMAEQSPLLNPHDVTGINPGNTVSRESSESEREPYSELYNSNELELEEGNIARGNPEAYYESFNTGEIANEQHSAHQFNQSAQANYEYDILTNQFDYFAPEADPVLFYEDVKVRSGETIIGLAAEYGFDPDDWREIWKDPKNATLVAQRKLSCNLREGDILNIPIKWRITNKKLEPHNATFRMIAERTGKDSGRLDWVQTVYGHNQPNFPVKPFPAFSVDLPTEDDNPFYWTQKEYDHLLNDFENMPVFRTKIKDEPFRNPPTAAQGATTWRAVTSLCVATHKRVSIWDTFVWGINFTVKGPNERYDIRPATNDEINGHLNLLRRKTGKSKRTFTDLGWVFRSRNKVTT